MLSRVFASGLSPQQALELANLHLENALTTKDPELALKCCDYAEAALSRMKRPAKKIVMSSLRADDLALRDGIAAAYSEIGKLLISLGNSAKAQVSNKKAEKWG
ncbi:hypothetical protein EDD21DRAFT_356115 [Dissophora ornata]|nr:hypothetical protein EDD21DRAFT_356115 [Dissophora ornata]